MSDGAPVDELLARLVAQFASPYDFLRELVQNAMDAGTDRVDITLRAHPVGGEDVVLELEVVDSGSGMDEAILDGALTRLFSSSKTGDRTMAGGFGIGFVSVFAWEPDIVLLQTGRGNESWELMFGADRRFEKHRADEPFEGTTVRLFKRANAAERAGVAEAVRDSLWRWCRFCPVEVRFEDEGAGGSEVVHDTPLPGDEVLLVVHEQGATRLRVAFAVPPHAVLLRNGLVLAEGSPAELLPAAGQAIAASFDHLRVWADSPSLRTDIGRDHVVDDSGRAAIERTIVQLVVKLRDELVMRLAALADSSAPWSAELHRQYAYLHAHVRCEVDAFGKVLAKAPLVRRCHGKACSFDALARAAMHGVVAWVEPDRSDAAELAAIAEHSGVPAVYATAEDADGWLGEWLAAYDRHPSPIAKLVRRVEPAEPHAESMMGLLTHALGRLRRASAVKLGRFEGEPDELWGRELSGAPPIVLTAASVDGPGAICPLWLDERHVLVRAALVHHPVQPLVAVATLLFAVMATWPQPRPELADVIDVIDELRKEAPA
ncbi:MAG TPA: ATP-binding protein [Nannocystaceae bacterium]|nr:ATP-binding protein [Nannocystaceae bacterium]